MNEGMYVYLNFDKIPMENEEKVLEHVDEILLQHHIRYSNFQNLYVPENRDTRDTDIYEGRQALFSDVLLKDGITSLPVATMTNVCPLEKIQVKEMEQPRARKYFHYETYFKKTGRLASDIVVDEYGRLRDGYISYLLAKEYQIPESQLSIVEALACQPVYKLVIGRHVEPKPEGKGYLVKSQKPYIWLYDIQPAVVPGDILSVGTRHGDQLIRVDRVEMRTGRCWRRGLCRVKKHL